jgi:exosortase
MAAPGALGVVAAAVLGLVAVSLPVVLELVALWRAVSYYSHGFLIPCFSAWLVWDLWRTDNRAASAPARYPSSAGRPRPGQRWAAGVTWMVAVGLLLIGTAGASLTVRALAVPVSALAFALTVADCAFVARLAFPLGFLALIVPLPEGALPRLSLALQHLAAATTEAGLRLAGIRSVRDGLFIHLEAATLHVSEACNGLRFLLAMLTIGIAFAGLTARGWIGRTAIVALALVVAVAGNVVRVFGTALIAHGWGSEAATGVMHVVYGKLIYAAMLVPFLAGVLIIRRQR